LEAEVAGNDRSLRTGTIERSQDVAFSNGKVY